MEMFFDDAGDLTLSGEIAKTLQGLEAKSFAKQTLDKVNSFHSLLAESQEHQGLWDAIPTL